MGFDNKYYLAAENEINAIQQKNRRTESARLAEVREKFPDIAAILDTLTGTSSKLFLLIADNGNNIKQKLEDLETENVEAQAKLKKALISHGYPENYLDNIYDCKLCKDTGISDGKRCRCFTDKVRKAAAADINSYSALQLKTFDSFDLSYYDDKTVTPFGATARKIMEYNLNYCKEYADDFHLPYKSLVMRGKTGLGKTHLSLAIVSAVIEKGYNAIYGSAPDIFKMINQEYYGKTDGNTDTLGMMISADLLVLDDVGAEFDSQFYRSMLYTIVNDRTSASLPTVINTNLDHKEIEARYGERVYSRMSSMEELLFTGSDVRIKIATGQK